MVFHCNFQVRVMIRYLAGNQLFLNVFCLKLLWIFVWHRWFFSIRSFYARFIFHPIRSISTNHAFLRDRTCRSRVRPIRTSIRWALASHTPTLVFVFIGNRCPIFANSVAVHRATLTNFLLFFLIHFYSYCLMNKTLSASSYSSSAAESLTRMIRETSSVDDGKRG